MTTPKATNRYFPNPDHYSSHQQWDDVRKLYEHVYNAQDEAAKAKPAPVAPTNGDISRTGPSNTQIAGLNVVGTPTNGQTLKFNSLTGQLEWG
jgi:hypothetical protein